MIRYERQSSHPESRLFCDFENIVLGVRDVKYAAFDIHKVLERLLLKGSIVVKKAYCDWDRYKEFRKAMHEAAFDLIEIPHVRLSGKNSAGIGARAYTQPVSCFLLPDCSRVTWRHNRLGADREKIEPYNAGADSFVSHE